MPELLLDDMSTPPAPGCRQCGGTVTPGSAFCNFCGARQMPGVAAGNSWALLKQAALFFSIDLVACCLVKFTKLFDTLGWYLFVDILMAVSAVCFFALNWKENRRLFKWQTFSFQKLCAYAAIAVAGSFIVHYSVNWLNVIIFNKDEHYFELLKGNIWGSVLVIFFTAVMPAIFEELGYRGYLLQTLLKVTEPDQAVYISALLFAFIHMSFLSLFWLVPFALFLGFTRLRENTIWYGVFFHFCFNLTACLFELL